MKKLKFLLVFLIIIFIFDSWSIVYANHKILNICPKSSEVIFFLNFSNLNKYLEKENLKGKLNDYILNIKEFSSIDILKDVNYFIAVLSNISVYKENKNPNGAFIFIGNFNKEIIEKKLEKFNLQFNLVTFSNNKVKMFEVDKEVYLSVPTNNYIVYGNAVEVDEIVKLIFENVKSSQLSFENLISTNLLMEKFNFNSLVTIINLPKQLSEHATNMAKLYKEQAVFSNLIGLLFYSSEKNFTFQYIYDTIESAKLGEQNAKIFMENGFKQITNNFKKITDSGMNQLKVANERFNFVKKGLVLLVKLQNYMTIKQIDKNVIISFDLTKVKTEVNDFILALIDNFMSQIAKSSKLQIKSSQEKIESQN